MEKNSGVTHLDERSVFRKALGDLKWQLLKTCVYNWRAKRGQDIRRAQQLYVDRLPTVKCSSNPEFEIHMLCCHRDVDMGIWSTWSALRVMSDRARMVIHSDGTLTGEDVGRWQSIVCGTEVVERTERDDVVRQRLEAEYPRLYKWRCQNWASAQLVDMHLFSNTKSILVMDSDVLTFAFPAEVIDALTSSPPRFAWCLDLLNAYSAPPDVIKEITGKTLPPRLCAGYLVSPRLTEDNYETLERDLAQLEADGRVDLNHFWSCQTYYGLLAAESATASPLPDQYSNTTTATIADQPMRHYVGNPSVRYRYFVEGVPRIMQDAFRTVTVGSTPL